MLPKKLRLSWSCVVLLKSFTPLFPECRWAFCPRPGLQSGVTQDRAGLCVPGAPSGLKDSREDRKHQAGGPTEGLPGSGRVSPALVTTFSPTGQGLTGPDRAPQLWRLQNGGWRVLEHS